MCGGGALRKRNIRFSFKRDKRGSGVKWVKVHQTGNLNQKSKLSLCTSTEVQGWENTGKKPHTTFISIRAE